MALLSLTLVLKFLLFENLLPHLAIAEHRKQNGAPEHVSGERRQEELHGCVVEGKKTRNPAIKHLGRTRDDMGELEERNQISQKADDQELPGWKRKR